MSFSRLILFILPAKWLNYFTSVESRLPQHWIPSMSCSSPASLNTSVLYLWLGMHGSCGLRQGAMYQTFQTSRKTWMNHNMLLFSLTGLARWYNILLFCFCENKMLYSSILFHRHADVCVLKLRNMPFGCDSVYHATKRSESANIPWPCFSDWRHASIQSGNSLMRNFGIELPDGVLTMIPRSLLSQYYCHIQCRATSKNWHLFSARFSLSCLRREKTYQSHEWTTEWLL